MSRRPGPVGRHWRPRTPSTPGLPRRSDGEPPRDLSPTAPVFVLAASFGRVGGRECESSLLKLIVLPTQHPSQQRSLPACDAKTAHRTGNLLVRPRLPDLQPRGQSVPSGIFRMPSGLPSTA
jgi:hypothetical protein